MFITKKRQEVYKKHVSEFIAVYMSLVYKLYGRTLSKKIDSAMLSLMEADQEGDYKCDYCKKEIKSDGIPKDWYTIHVWRVGEDDEEDAIGLFREVCSIKCAKGLLLDWAHVKRGNNVDTGIINNSPGTGVNKLQSLIWDGGKWVESGWVEHGGDIKYMPFPGMRNYEGEVQ